MAEPPDDEHAGLWAALDLGRVPTGQEYSDIFLFQLYPYASVHLGREGMLGGEARDRIAGFWSAVGAVPPAEPDHLSALIGLYLSLAEREAGSDDGAERTLNAEARRALLAEHLTPWVFAYLTRITELTEGPYRRWAELLHAVLKEEVRIASVAEGLVAATHLREVPPLGDPRREGASDFLEGLLAPVRAGVLLTRADLAKVARSADLGLRAGERRYALEHLLAQDPPQVLELLAVEARRQARSHSDRVGWLGASSEELSRRAVATAALLDELAAEERAGVHEDGASEAVIA